MRASRRRDARGMRLFFLLAFSLLFSCASIAAAPRAVTTFESIGIYWTPPSNPGPAGCAIQFRKAGDAAWRDGLPLWFDARNGECRGSLVQLDPGTKYEIQLAGAQLTAQTWSERFP